MKTANAIFALLVFFFSLPLAQAQTVGSTAAIFQGYNGDKGQERTQSGARIVSIYQEGVAITQYQGRYGLVTERGYELVLPSFDKVRFFHNGYAAVCKNNVWTFINKQGNRIAPFRYDWVANFENGHAAVSQKGLWGFINEQGQEITPLQYELVRPFGDNGRALARRQGQWFEIDFRGQETPVIEASVIEAVELF